MLHHVSPKSALSMLLFVMQKEEMLRYGFTEELMVDLRWFQNKNGQCKQAYGNEVAHEITKDLLEFRLIMEESEKKPYTDLFDIALKEQRHQDNLKKEVSVAKYSECLSPRKDQLMGACCNLVSFVCGIVTGVVGRPVL